MNRRQRRGAALPQSPAWLLDPSAGVVPFTGRQAELATLLGWCLNPSAGPVRLVSGGAGAGKTRLARELAGELRPKGWQTQWLCTGAEPDDTPPSRYGLLLVVDEAEPRADLTGLLAWAVRARDRTRVLLLARATGGWLDRLQAAEPPLGELAANAYRLELALADALAPGLAALDVVRGALPWFAERLDRSAPEPERVSFTGLDRARVLDLHAAAIVAVIESGQGRRQRPVPVDAGRALERLLDHERDYWPALAVRRGLRAERNTGRLAQLAAVGGLLGAGTEAEAAELTGRVPGLDPSSAAESWLHPRYPASRWLGPLWPGRLAELHVTRELTASPSLARQCLIRLDHRQARQALTLLAQAAADQPDARRLLGTALTALAEVISGGPAGLEVVIAVVNALPSPSMALAETEASLTSQVIAAAGPGTADRAAWLVSYSRVLALLGRRDEALAAASEAVEIYREEDPGAFRPALAAALTSQATRLDERGRTADALAASSEAVAIYRERGRGAFRPALGAALIAQSTGLLRLERRAAALTAARQSVAIYRKLAAARPGPFRPLAGALALESACLVRLERPADAVAVITEAVAAFRDLAAARPDAFRPELAAALEVQSVGLAGLGRGADALAAAEEATSRYRELEAGWPGAFRSSLAAALTSQSRRLSALGRNDEAEAARREAAEITGG
jgi:tetratricopeptide (TPR) repeat protein